MIIHCNLFKCLIRDV